MGGRKGASLTAARHVGLCSANTIKPLPDPSATHSGQRGGGFCRSFIRLDGTIDTIIGRGLAVGPATTRQRPNMEVTVYGPLSILS